MPLACYDCKSPRALELFHITAPYVGTVLDVRTTQTVTRRFGSPSTVLQLLRKDSPDNARGWVINLPDKLLRSSFCSRMYRYSAVAGGRNSESQ